MSNTAPQQQALQLNSTVLPNKTVNKQITIVARFKAKLGMEDRLEQALLDVVAPSRAESYYISYDVHRSVDNPPLFVLYENWINQAALNQHVEKPYFKANVKLFKEILAEPFEGIRRAMISTPAR